jgi:hypothetical protein
MEPLSLSALPARIRRVIDARLEEAGEVVRENVNAYFDRTDVDGPQGVDSKNRVVVKVNIELVIEHSLESHSTALTARADLKRPKARAKGAAIGFQQGQGLVVFPDDIEGGEEQPRLPLGRAEVPETVAVRVVRG